MKWLIASDIHGSALYCRELLHRAREERADRILLLGDLLYHGPRNDLPDGYAPKEVIALLNEQASRLLCVRGNCEAEVDQMVLSFPVLAEYAVLSLGDRLVFATHGHHTPPPLQPGDILLYGHTHIPQRTQKDGITVLNPGSVSLPKAGSRHAYMTWENGLFLWKDLLTGESFEPERKEDTP